MQGCPARTLSKPQALHHSAQQGLHQGPGGGSGSLQAPDPRAGPQSHPHSDPRSGVGSEAMTQLPGSRASLQRQSMQSSQHPYSSPAPESAQQPLRAQPSLPYPRGQLPQVPGQSPGSQRKLPQVPGQPQAPGPLAEGAMAGQQHQQQLHAQHQHSQQRQQQQQEQQQQPMEGQSPGQQASVSHMEASDAAAQQRSLSALQGGSGSDARADRQPSMPSSGGGPSGSLSQHVEGVQAQQLQVRCSSRVALWRVSPCIQGGARRHRRERTKPNKDKK